MQSDQKSDQYYKYCPYFQKCSVNHCPLDSFQEIRETVPGDPERKCRLSKSKRLEIVQEHNCAKLPYDGLTRKEYAEKKKWERLALEKRERLKNIGVQNITLKNKGQIEKICI